MDCTQWVTAANRIQFRELRKRFVENYRPLMFMCVAVVALSLAILLYVLLLLSSFIVQLRLSTFNKVYDDDDGSIRNFCTGAS